MKLDKKNNNCSYASNEKKKTTVTVSTWSTYWYEDIKDFAKVPSARCDKRTMRQAHDNYPTFGLGICCAILHIDSFLFVFRLVTNL